MKYIKRIISIVLVAVIFLVTTPINAQAQANLYNLKIVQDTYDLKIVEASDDDYTYTTTLNKVDNTIQLNTTDIETKVTEYGNVTSIVPLKENDRFTLNASLKENTFTNYEYTKTYGNPNKWELRRPDSSIFSWYYFKTDETSSNKADLDKFKSYVDQINTLEGQLILELGLSVLSVVVSGAAGAGAIFTGGTLTPAAWASIATAAGVNAKYLNTLMTYDTACKNAYDRYWTVYYLSDVY